MENQTDNKKEETDVALVISKETLLKEIEGSKKAIETMENSILINKLVLAAFEAELAKLD